MGATPGTLTPATASDVFGALLAAGVPQSGVTMVAAQSALETAGWTAMWNWNLGNITTAGVDYVTLPGNSLHFAAYSDLQTGANAFVSYLQKHNVPLDGSDLSAYVAQLQAIGYAGNADYTAYQSGMASWITKLGGTVPSVGISNPALQAVLIVAGGAGLWWLIERGYLDGALASARHFALRVRDVLPV